MDEDHTIELTYKGINMEIWKCKDCERTIEFIFKPIKRRNVIKQGNILTAKHKGGYLTFQDMDYR